jgi:hypothetical protein
MTFLYTDDKPVENRVPIKMLMTQKRLKKNNCKAWVEK